MIEVREWIPEVFDGVKHGLLKRSIIRVVQDELVHVQLSVLDTVQVFVVRQNLCHSSIRLHNALFGAEESWKIDFELLEEGVHFLDVAPILSDCILETLKLMLLILRFVNHSCLGHAIVKIFVGHLSQFSKCFFDIETSRPEEYLAFRSVNDELVAW